MKGLDSFSFNLLGELALLLSADVLVTLWSFGAWITHLGELLRFAAGFGRLFGMVVFISHGWVMCANNLRSHLWR